VTPVSETETSSTLPTIKKRLGVKLTPGREKQRARLVNYFGKSLEEKVADLRAANKQLQAKLKNTNEQNSTPPNETNVCSNQTKLETQMDIVQEDMQLSDSSSSSENSGSTSEDSKTDEEDDTITTLNNLRKTGTEISPVENLDSMDVLELFETEGEISPP